MGLLSGLFGSSTKRKIPKMGPEETALMDMIEGPLIESYMDSVGYEVTKTETKYEDSKDYEVLQAKRKSVEEMLSKPNLTPDVVKRLSTQLDTLDAQEENERRKFKPEVDYDTRQKADKKTEAVREKYGEDSPEYKAALEDYKQKQIDLEVQSEGISIMAMDLAEKYMKGDYSLNENQSRFVDDVLGPVKKANLDAIKYLKEEAGLTEGRLSSVADNIEKSILSTKSAVGAALGNLGTQIKNTGKNMKNALDQFRSQVKQTGLSMNDAILELEDRTRTTGASMKNALAESVELGKSLMKMNIQDNSRETRRYYANQASRLGRSASDPEFQKEMMTSENRFIAKEAIKLEKEAALYNVGIEERTGSGLEAASRLRLGTASRTGGLLEEAARTGMGIEERTGIGLENLASARANLEQRTGESMTNLEGTRLGIAERTSNTAEAIARLRGETGAGVAETEANLRTQLGMGQIPSTFGFGIGAGQTSNIAQGKKTAKAGSAIGAVSSIADKYLTQRLAQPTTTTTPSLFDAATSVAGAAAGVYGAFKGGGGGFSGGGLFSPGGEGFNLGNYANKLSLR